MARTTVDFGIDLGTTNSEIAVVDKGQVRVVRNHLAQEITPSAVRIDRKGTVIVGKLAFDNRVTDKENTHTQFKRLMGSQQTLNFPSAGRRLKPEDLSSEVLKSLRQDVLREAGEEIAAAVITIPALFEIPQCDATRRAAELAGIPFCPLLQEPIAAALAYGFEVESLDGFLLVYDLGGGTFDASLIRTVDGRLHVIDHAGDNFLGGKDFDERLLDHFIRRLQGEAQLRSLDPVTDRTAIAKLLAEAENAKIQLSSSPNAYISITNLGRGLEDFDASFDLSRREYESFIEPFVRKTTDICHQLLANNHLSQSALSRIILVGGPTLTPYVRSAVEGSLGIKPEFKVDPMTIVARGAALFAASQRVPKVSSTRTAKGTVRLALAFNPVSQDVEADVAGKLVDARELPNVRIEISRMDGGWTSGKLALTNNAFLAPVALNKREVNEFRIELFDQNGNTLKCEPELFAITQGAMVEDAPLSRTIRLGLSDNTTHVLIQKGATVPCQVRTRRGEIVTSHEVSRGESKNILNMPVLQGENERSDRNREIATLTVSGTDIARSLPAGSDVEIVAELNRDFTLRVTVFIPLLSETFEVIKGDTIAPVPRLEEMQADLQTEKNRLSELVGRSNGGNAPVRSDEAGEATVTVKELEAQLVKARGSDQDAAERARRGIEDLKARIDLIEEAQRWPALQARLEEAKRRTHEAVSGSNEPRDAERFQKLFSEAAAAVATKDAERLEKAISSLESLMWEIWARQDDFWVASFHNVAKFASQFMDGSRGNSLMEEGALAVERSDFASLRSIVRELWGLVPDSEETTAGDILFPSSLKKRNSGYL